MSRKCSRLLSTLIFHAPRPARGRPRKGRTVGAIWPVSSRAASAFAQSLLMFVRDRIGRPQRIEGPKLGRSGARQIRRAGVQRGRERSEQSGQNRIGGRQKTKRDGQ